MLIHVVTASINQLANLENLENLVSTSPHEIKFLVIDEGDRNIRRKNDKLMSNLPHEFYGPKERQQWFRRRFGRSYKKYMDLIPRNCHAETSFGFLRAYEEQPQVILQLDDDVYFTEGFLSEHLSNLFDNSGVTVDSRGKWYNTIENLHLSSNHRIFPRGHPYSPLCRQESYVWTEKGDISVLNMGLWNGQPDLDAVTILYHGGLDGTCTIESEGFKKEKVILGKETYFAICSMNTSFLSKVVPAYYQLYMNFMGIDRFDDIWSGIFLKKIADHLGDKMSLGKPSGLHLKRRRNIFKDLEKEMKGLDMNEHIWKISEEADLSGKTYSDCYLELAEHIKNTMNDWIKNSENIKFWNVQTEKMMKWVELVDEIS